VRQLLVVNTIGSKFVTYNIHFRFVIPGMVESSSVLVWCGC